MMKINKNKKGQAGFVITVELLLIVTVLVMGMIAGWAKLRDQTVAELSDLGSAIGAIDQSYEIDGHTWSSTGTQIASFAGFTYVDGSDIDSNTTVGGDDAMVVYNQSSGSAQTGTGYETDSLY